jgi:hypothetical protein
MPTLVVGMSEVQENHSMSTQAWTWHPIFRLSATETK